MTWLTLTVNPPEQIRPILGKSADKFGLGANYTVIDVNESEHDADSLECVMRNAGIVYWKYAEDDSSEVDNLKLTIARLMAEQDEGVNDVS